PARWPRPRTARRAPRTRELAVLLLLLALGGCSMALWSCPPGGGVLGGGGCRVLLVRGLTEVDLFIVADGKTLTLGSKPDAAAIAAAALLAHQVPQPATR